MKPYGSAGVWKKTLYAMRNYVLTYVSYLFARKKVWFPRLRNQNLALMVMLNFKKKLQLS